MLGLAQQYSASPVFGPRSNKSDGIVEIIGKGDGRGGALISGVGQQRRGTDWGEIQEGARRSAVSGR